MAEQNKRYYWLKLQNTYFNRLEQKKMRKQENGKDMQIIYLRMMLLSLDKGGYIYYQGVYDSIEEELAEEFLEDVSIVRETIQYLSENNMISFDEESNCFIPQAVDCTGSECYSAERVRRHREKKASQCNTNVTEGNAHVTPCNEEIEKRDRDRDRDREEKDNIEPSAPICCDNDDNGMDPMEAMKLWNQRKENVNHQLVADMYNETCVSLPPYYQVIRCTQKSNKGKAE